MHVILVALWPQQHGMCPETVSLWNAPGTMTPCMEAQEGCQVGEAGAIEGSH